MIGSLWGGAARSAADLRELRDAKTDACLPGGGRPRVEQILEHLPFRGDLGRPEVEGRNDCSRRPVYGGSDELEASREKEAGAFQPEYQGVSCRGLPRSR